MEQLDQLKALTADFQRHQSALKKQAREYEALQREIAELRKRSAFDPDARRKLQRLDDAMRSGGKQLQEQIAEKTANLETVCARLGEELKKLAPVGDGRSIGSTPSPKSAAPKKVARAFV
jgi:predicted RNase H-like nuclease (RuvC/YqgF family)